MNCYEIKRTVVIPELNGKWDGPVWTTANTVQIDQFRPESSGHRPVTAARLLYDADCIYGIYRVEDRYVRSIQTEFQSSVCRDSCVEFFVKPQAANGYFNFEFNCGGTMLCFYIIDPTRSSEGGIKNRVMLNKGDGDMVRIYHSMPQIVEPEITEPTTWLLEFAIPVALLERYAGVIGDPARQEWRANLYKCGDKTSHPHWASWAPVPQLNFHLPESFGVMKFS